MEIRELNENDLESLIHLYEQLDPSNGNISIDTTREIWRNEIVNNKNIKYFGAVDNGKVVSTCYCMIIPNLTSLGRAICFVENVVTDKDYRKQGLATKILDKAIEFAHEKNCYKVILESGIKRKEAHQFYANYGFDGDAKKAFIIYFKDKQ